MLYQIYSLLFIYSNRFKKYFIDKHFKKVTFAINIYTFIIYDNGNLQYSAFK